MQNSVESGTAADGRRLLAVWIPMLSQDHRQRIRQAAGRCGLETSFCETEAEAQAALPGAEVYFGPAIPLIGARSLKWLALPSAGVEPFTRPGILPEGVILTNASGAYGVTIAEHIVMVTLEMMRRRAEYLDIVANRGWQRDLPIRSIHGSRILILGTGDIGRETARRLRAFSPAAIVGVNRSGVCPEPLFDRVLTAEGLDKLLPEQDLVILCLPGTPETRDLMNAARLALLPETAYVVNVGRGGCLDEDALAKALRGGKLAGAALDVFRTEPLPADSPLWEVPNLIITPHISGNMTLRWTMERVVAIFLKNLSSYAAGEPLSHTVDPARAY